MSAAFAISFVEQLHSFSHNYLFKEHYNSFCQNKKGAGDLSPQKYAARLVG